MLHMFSPLWVRTVMTFFDIYYITQVMPNMHTSSALKYHIYLSSYYIIIICMDVVIYMTQTLLLQFHLIAHIL